MLDKFTICRLGHKTNFVSIAIVLWLIVLGAPLSQSQINPCSFGGIQSGYTAGFKLDKLPDDVKMSELQSGNVWRFGSLQSVTFEKYRFEKSQNGQYSYHFPQADYVLINADGSEQYYTNKNATWSIVGEASLKKGSIEPQLIDYVTPLAGCYPQLGQSSRSYNIPLEVQNQDGGIVKVYKKIKDSRGISGKLFLPEGVYDDTYRIEREVVYDYGPSDTEVYDTKGYHSYLFLDKISGELLMEARLETDRSIDWIKYKSTDTDVSFRSRVGKNQFSLYPSTSFGDNLRLDFLNFETGNYTLEINNIMGKRIWSRAYNIAGNSTIKENLSFLPKGTYIYALLDANRNRIATRKLAIIKA